MVIAEFNERWLAAWTARDPKEIVSFYDDNLTYFDSNVPNGVRGKAAFLAYVTQYCESGPAIVFRPHEVWGVEGGFAGRWFGSLETPEGTAWLRGFDLCLVKDSLITHNELYTHTLNAPPSTEAPA